jgi:hypothetical protein
VLHAGPGEAGRMGAATSAQHTRHMSQMVRRAGIMMTLHLDMMITKTMHPIAGTTSDTESALSPANATVKCIAK